MPIVTIDTTKQLEFGHGDIEVASGLLESEDIIGVVCFFQRETPNPIGAKGTFLPHQVVPVEDTNVRMTFEKVESIDVVIDALEKAKKYMLAKTVIVD